MILAWHVARMEEKKNAYRIVSKIQKETEEFLFLQVMTLKSNSAHCEYISVQSKVRI
jgi:hypothetical protein